MPQLSNPALRALFIFLLATLTALAACSDDPEPVGNDDQNPGNDQDAGTDADADENDADPPPTACEATAWECAEFVDGAPLSVRRHGHVSVVLDHERVLLLGGSKREEGSPASTSTNTWEVFNVETEEVEGHGVRPVYRENFTAVKLDYGSVLTLGGTFNQNPLTSIDHFDPEEMEWTSELPSMERPARDAALLEDGRVAVVGVGSDDVFAQIFNPEDLSWSALVEADLSVADVDQTSIEILPDGQAVFTVNYVTSVEQGVSNYNGAIYSFDVHTGDVEELEHFGFGQPNVYGSSTILPYSEKALLHFRTASLEGSESPARGYLFDPTTGDLDELYNRDPSPGNIHAVLPGDEVIFEDGQVLQLFDVPTDTWRVFMDLPENIYYSSMDILPDCRMFMSGERTIGASLDNLRGVDTAFCLPAELEDDDENGDDDNGENGENGDDDNGDNGNGD